MSRLNKDKWKERKKKERKGIRANIQKISRLFKYLKRPRSSK